VFVGAVLGLTVRLLIPALSTAGFVIAQQTGVGLVTAVDPSQGQQSVIVGNFLNVARPHAGVRDRSPSPRDRRAQRQLYAVASVRSPLVLVAGAMMSVFLDSLEGILRQLAPTS